MPCVSISGDWYYNRRGCQHVATFPHCTGSHSHVTTHHVNQWRMQTWACSSHSKWQGRAYVKLFLMNRILFVLFWFWWRYQKVLYLLFQARDKVTIVNKVWRQIIKAAVVGLGLHSPSTSRVSRCRGPTGGTTCGDAPPSSWTTIWRSAAVNEHLRSFTVPVESPGLLLVENTY